MRGMKKYLASTVLSAALLFTCAANAMQIPQFDKMDHNDRSKYVTLLVEGAAKGLTDHGQTDQARKLINLFKDSSDKGGGYQFAKHLQIARDLNKQTDPKQPPYEVENALEVTLKDNGITVPVSFLLALGKDFKPSSPPSEKTKQTR
jgi:hypothetical protein